MSEQSKPSESLSPQQQILEILKDFPGAPSAVQVEEWKATFGDLFVSGFSEEELYVWRPLRRSEHRKIQIAMATPPREGEEELDALKQEENVCNICVLWPAAPHDWERRAGTATTLCEQIMQQSHFLTPAAASMLVVKLS